LELIAVMELGVVGGSIDPVTEPAYGIGVALVLLAVMLIVNVGPDTTGEALLSKKVDSVTEVLVTQSRRLWRNFCHWRLPA
jgi:hypothetical protein